MLMRKYLTVAAALAAGAGLVGGPADPAGARQGTEDGAGHENSTR
ncbi:hypothetical protein [Streptomyces sp. 3N207]